MSIRTSAVALEVSEWILFFCKGCEAHRIVMGVVKFSILDITILQ